MYLENEQLIHNFVQSKLLTYSDGIMYLIFRSEFDTETIQKRLQQLPLHLVHPIITLNGHV